MHLLLLNDDVLGPGSRGGVAVVVDQYRRAYAAAGHRVTLITTHQDPSRDAEVRSADASGEIISLLVDVPLKGRHRRCVAQTPVVRRVGELLQELRPDAVHAHNVHTYLGYPVLSAARAITPHVVLSAHDTFLVSFARVGGPRYEAACTAGHPYRMPWWEHLRTVGREYWPLRNGAIRRIVRTSTSAVVPCSVALKAFLEANAIPCGPVIPHPAPVLPDVAPSRIEAFRRQYAVDGPAMLFGGRLSGDKGLTAFLAAAERVVAMLPSARFVIVGDADRLAPSLAGCSPALHAALRTTGWLPVEEFAVAVAACDALTVPSVYLDAMPTMTLWALASGRPVVGTCFGGTPELLHDGETGFVIHPGHAQEYAEKMLAVLSHPDRARAMGDAGRRFVQEHNALAVIAGEYLTLLTSVS